MAEKKKIIIRVKDKEKFLEQVMALVHLKGETVQSQAFHISDSSINQRASLKTLGYQSVIQPSVKSEVDQPIKTEMDQFSYQSYLTRNEKSITFVEFISATLKWAASAVEASSGDLRGYLTHLSFITDLEATQKYDPQVHVDYDSAVRGQAEKHGWQAFKAKHRNVALSFYGEANAETVGTQNQSEIAAPLHVENMIISSEKEIGSPFVTVEPVMFDNKTITADQESIGSDQESIGSDQGTWGLSCGMGGDRVEVENHGWQAFKSGDRDVTVPYYADANSAVMSSQNQRLNTAFVAPLQDSVENMIIGSDTISPSHDMVNAEPDKIENTHVAFKKRTISNKNIDAFLCAAGDAEQTNIEKAQDAVTYSSQINNGQHFSSVTKQCSMDAAVDIIDSRLGEETKVPAPLSTELAAIGEGGDDRSQSNDSTIPAVSASTSSKPEQSNAKLHAQLSVPKKIKRVHICSYCGREFRGSVTACQEHERLHTGEKPYKCTHCGNQYRTSQHLKKHALSHTGEKRFACSYCNKECFKAFDLKAHEMIHTGEKPNLCSICGVGFRQLGKLKVHMLRHTGETPHRCVHCGQRFRLREALRVHMRHHVGEEPPRHSIQTYRHLKKFEPSHKCHHCDKIFTLAHKLKAHEMIHTGEKPHLCSVCGNGFRLLSTLQIHMVTHTGQKPHVCSDCGKGFNQLHSLHVHRMSHTGEKPYTCSECGKGFIQQSVLTQHAVVHTGEKPHVCSACDRGFNSLANLTRHMRTHTGEKPYICSHCDKAFGQKSSLQLHAMIHTGEKPFVCSECGKGFCRAADLRKHMKVHGGVTVRK